MRKSKKMVIMVIAVIMVMSLGLTIAHARDIGYTGSSSTGASQTSTFSGTARIKESSNKDMSVNAQPGGSKPGSITGVASLQFGCKMKYDLSVACTPKKAQTVVHGGVGYNNFNTGKGISGQGYYLTVYNPHSTTANYAMSWCPDRA